MNGTVAYGFSPLSQLKVSGEYLAQRLPFQFDSGNIMQRLHQSAYGVRFQQLFVKQPYWQSINLGGYYANAANKDLPPVIFSTNGTSYLNERHIAGARSSGIDIGTGVLLSPKTLLGGNVYFDSVRYGTQLTGDTSQNHQGLGGGIKLKQLFGENFKLWGEISIRKIYNNYEGGVSWLPLPKLLGLELSVLSQHVVFHNSMPNNSNVSLQVKCLPNTNPHYDKCCVCENKHLPTVSQWMKTPAVYMPQVLALAEQITTRSVSPDTTLLSITSITPTSGPLSGGAVVTIRGTGFVVGTVVTFGGVAGVVTSVNASGTEITVTTPAGTRVGPVDIVVTTPNDSVTQTGGYTYANEPIIDNLSPNTGPRSGGTVITITGTDFKGTTSVTFGGVEGTNISVNSSGTEITVTVPEAIGPSGPVEVIVTTPSGSSLIDPSITTYTYT